MKKLFTATVLTAALVGAAHADSIKIGVALGFTGPAESLAGPMAAGAEMALKEASDSGAFLGGTTITAVRADSTCIDAAAATAAAERLVSSEQVKAIIGGLCSGATTAMLKNVAMAKGIVLFSPSATSPALTTIPDNGLFFRASPSDARQGQIIAQMLKEKGIKSAALTYTNNDYGKGLADSIKTNVEATGGKITIYASHEDGKGDYTAEVGALASAGGDILIVAGYLDQGGRGIIRSALDTGAFERFFLPDAMIGESLTKAIGSGLNGSFGVVPGTDSPGAKQYTALAAKAGFKDGPYSPESYDAAALTVLAMQAAKSTDSSQFKAKVFEVANAPGEKIYPGEIAKGLAILAKGGQIDYVGASAVELIEPGESAGSYREVVVKGGQFDTVGYR
ncbi:MAG: ABC transporter substrate-binding protein [Burkholderiaceae bacterium]|jgi:branched-chain amino acid transport system substrate-binding protein|nr:ABC transporter substrate-binding protein [Betaproteobacteria bacterium]MDB4136197.1 ABC transporter substrate-binding protein [Burkholderiaceae bacterium]MCH9847879.1 ABC transporter substrate-binding protein [Betaproteobacteria bacterium]MDC1457824.1 ABC transporter substrate-binding protein [Burkholderiaceae bacterium]MDG1109204.1 ABC transporter substrate-binding protein [Burkholderiaceae bacterium]